MLTLINTRRSVRKWIEKPVSETDIHDIVEAGMNAPSAGNEQAWQMIVLTDKALMEKISATNKNIATLRNAPAAILVCGDLNAQKYDGYYVHDCCAATENILLAIHAKGLGGVWGNVFPDHAEGFRQLLNIPADIIPFSIIPFGHIDGVPAYESRFNPQKLHFNQW